MITQRERIKSILYACVVYVRRLLVGFVCVGRASRVEARRQRCMAKLVFTLVWLGRMFACAFMFCMRSWVRDCAPATLQARTHTHAYYSCMWGLAHSDRVKCMSWDGRSRSICGAYSLSHTHTHLAAGVSFVVRVRNARRAMCNSKWLPKSRRIGIIRFVRVCCIT